MKTLIVVESPTKARTIKNYLSKDYELFATMGHIKDLAIKGKNGYGVLLEEGFKAEYEVISSKEKIVDRLKKAAENKNILIASDFDREGEAIAWHVKEELKLDDSDQNRIYFTEITKEAILEAVEKPKAIDKNLFSSQETRRILDRIIGFDLSKLVKTKIGSISAGRVQSVALKMIIDREKEILEFKPTNYYLITALFKEFKADYVKNSNKSLTNKEEAQKLIETIGKEFTVSEIDEKEVNKYANFPYVTSTLQQDGIYNLKTTASNVMKIAQKLYEGVKIGKETVGLITYMRTDSFNLSFKFVNITKDYIKKTFGEEYVGFARTGRQRKGAQEAHEAIRPTSIYRTPESVKEYLDDKEFKLYNLIYYRTLAFLMKAALDLEMKVTLNANGEIFKANFSKELFDGYRKLENKKEEGFYPNLTLNEKLIANKVVLEEKQTKPKNRYSESTLIKAMEDSGIGRPSTYAETTRRITTAGYVRRIRGYFTPTDQGTLTANKLDEFFSDFINVNYTSKMEDDLDSISSGEATKENILKDFYEKFNNQVELANKKMEIVKREVLKTGEKCELCGKDLVYKENYKGQWFVGCSGYSSKPRCTFTRNITKEERKMLNEKIVN